MSANLEERRSEAGVETGVATSSLFDELLKKQRSLDAVSAGFESSAGFELLQRQGAMFANSGFVPDAYKAFILNKKTGEMEKNPQAIPSCCIAINMANRIGADPIMVMQNLVIVFGKPSWSAKFLIATANSCKRFSQIRYEFSGQEGTDNWGCRAVATETGTGEALLGMLVTIAMAKKEGWYSKIGSKWQTMPEKMLMYRAAAWWVDVFSPELSMGLRTDDELIDTVENDVVQSSPTVKLNIEPAVETVKTDPFAEIKKAMASAQTFEELDAILESVPKLKQPKVMEDYNKRIRELENGLA